MGSEEGTNLAEELRGFLRANPDFLFHEQELLQELTLPHLGLGAASSLLERQVQTLRQERNTLQNRIALLLETAQQNALLASHLGNLATALLAARDCSGTVSAILDQLRGGFQVEAIALVTVHSAAPLPRVRTVPAATLEELRGGNSGAATGITPSAGVRQQLFPDTPPGELHSFALIPLEGQHLLGAIVLASRDPERYVPGAGTDLLDQIACLASTALERCLS